MGVVLLATVGVPAVVTLGLAGNSTVIGVGNSAPESTSTVVLVTLSWTSAFIADAGRLNDSEVAGSVFLTTVRVPALEPVRLSGNSAVFSASNSAPEGACVVLVSLRVSWHIFFLLTFSY